jgi:hypothetical protein
LVFYCQNAPASTANPTSGEGIVFTSETLYHPAGPATRNEWRTSKDGRIVQLEIKNAKSGQILVESTRIIYQQKMGWRIEDIAENIKLKINPELINSQKPIKLNINNQMWEITLSNENTPIAIKGIATEAEPRVDIFMTLIK